MSKDKWIWMPHAGHLIVGSECKFHLSTYVNGYIVSTVGEWWPDEKVREIHAHVKGIKLEGIGDFRSRDFLKKCGYMKIGHDRIYETMVFKAVKSTNQLCRPWRMTSEEVDMEAYNDATEAYQGHLRLCSKWDRIKTEKKQC